MRVAIISSSFYPAISYGGPISATWDIAKGLSNKGISVYVSTTNANGSDKLDVKVNSFIKKQSNLFVKYYNEQIINRFSFEFVFGVWSDIKQADRIYIQYIFHYTVFIALMFSFFLRKKVILCPRGSLSPYALKYKHKWKKRIWLFFFIRPFVKKVIWHASSYIEKDDIRCVFHRARIVEISDGVLCEDFSNTFKMSKVDLVNKFTKHNCKDVSELFFSMGRLHSSKGFDVVIDAFDLFVENNPYAKLIIAGSDDGFKTKLINQIKKLNLSNSVFLIGSVDHKDKVLLLKNSSAFVLASSFESFGIVIAESLASGTPVIVSNRTPWKDIENNKCGIFTENNSDSFYNAFCDFQKMTFNSRVIQDFVCLNFDSRVIVNKFIDVIKSKD